MALRPDYRTALDRTALLDLLAPFDPRVVGTPPLALDIAGSDIDVIASAADPDTVADLLWHAYGTAPDFMLRRNIVGDRPLVARFEAHGWPIEIYVSPQPADGQAAWRHFVVEGRLLRISGDPLLAAVHRLRTAGLKTEPAFARALDLPGEPYAAVLALEGFDEPQLAGLVDRALRRRAAAWQENVTDHP